VADAIETISESGLRAEYHYLVNNPFEAEESLIETLRFVADHHRGPAKIRLFPLQFYPGSVMYRRAREAGVIDRRHEEAYRFKYRGKAFIKQARYLEIWLRVALALRGVGVPSRFVHSVIDFVLHRWTRACLDRGWFGLVSFGIYRAGHVIHKNLIVQLFVKPVAALHAQFQKRQSVACPPAG